CTQQDQQGPWWLLECGNPDQHCPSYIKSLQSPSWVLLSWLHLEKILSLLLLCVSVEYIPEIGR
ncbi:hypothetical protein K5549_021813, partial [Capra hircus]